MPVYEFECVEHGVFDAVRAMADYDKPCDCPVCGQSSRRVLRTAPRLAGRDRTTIRGQAVNERAADSPKRASQQGSDLSPPKKVSKNTFTHANGSKTVASSRPWMISY